MKLHVDVLSEQTRLSVVSVLHVCVCASDVCRESSMVEWTRLCVCPLSNHLFTHPETAGLRRCCLILLFFISFFFHHTKPREWPWLLIAEKEQHRRIIQASQEHFLHIVTLLAMHEQADAERFCSVIIGYLLRFVVIRQSRHVKYTNELKRRYIYRRTVRSFGI